MSSLAVTGRVLLRTARPLSSSTRMANQLVIRRQAHGHAPRSEIPFSTDNKKALAFKCILYMGTGFSIPFIAVWWTFTKNKRTGSDS